MTSEEDIDKSLMNSSSSSLSGLFEKIRVWNRGNERAPHKPLLLLLALGRVQRGEPRLVNFAAVESALRNLLREFGPTRTHYHPEYPFWRLKADGIWEVIFPTSLTRRTTNIERRKSNTDPTIASMRLTAGGFTIELDERLRNDPALLQELALSVLNSHFPQSLHESLLTAVGVELSNLRTPPRGRDPQFRISVMRAYGFKCAVCAFDAQLDGVAIGLEAAHVHWHSNQGPDVVENGLCLCVMHHKALDLGWFTIGRSRQILVSSRLHGGVSVQGAVGAFHGKPLLDPLYGAPPVSEVHAAWHRGEVFKSPARSG